MLAREGLLPVIVLAGTAAAVAFFAQPVWSAPLWLMLLIVIGLFAESPREIPAVPLGVLSPVDGTVRSVGLAADAWLDRDALAVRIEMRLPGITRVRSPTEGKVMDFITNFGARDAPADSPTSYVQWIRTDEDEDASVWIATYRHSRFKADVSPGERVGQGQPNGFVYFGRQVTVYVPADAHAEVAAGDRVTAGSSVIAKFVRAAG